MISKTVVVRTMNDLNKFVNRYEIDILLEKAASVLIQIFTSETDPQWAMSLEAILDKKFEKAVIVGASTMGEIAYGQLHIGSTVLSVTFFEKTEVAGFILDGSTGNPGDLGKTLNETIENIGQEIKGVLLLATTSNVDMSEFLTGFSNPEASYPVFGGGAWNYEINLEPLIFLNQEHYSKGVAAVVFMGDQITIEAHTYLGWQPLSKEMVITEMDGLWVKKIDDEPAFNVYQRYFDIQNDDDFFLNVLEFPLLLKRNGVEYAKVPAMVNEENAIKFLSDIKVGESFRIGYGNPGRIIEQANTIQNRIEAFNPESIFLYSCICRRFLLQDDVDMETKPFEAMAPTFGFYTYGEFYGQADQIQMLNATMVAVSMKERDQNIGKHSSDTKILASESLDIFANKHSRIILRLVNFIKVVTEELEEANKAATRLAERDCLTQTYNRMKVHEFMENEINRSQRYGSEFSIILLDLDFFKKVNDNYGHNVGDLVLVHLVKLLELEVRNIDMLSRWGGEEFLIVMPETGIKGAGITAERIRKVVEQNEFPQGIQQTCSIGVTSFRKGEAIEETIDRADKALYEAKEKGRNRVAAK